MRTPLAEFPALDTTDPKKLITLSKVVYAETAAHVTKLEDAKRGATAREVYQDGLQHAAYLLDLARTMSAINKDLAEDSEPATALKDSDIDARAREMADTMMKRYTESGTVTPIFKVLCTVLGTNHPLIDAYAHVSGAEKSKRGL